MHKITLFLSVLVVFLLESSCSKFRKIEKSQDWRVKYEAATSYYMREDYYRASILFEQIMPIIRGLPEGEKSQFYAAYCQFHQRYFLLSSEQFKAFYETYGRSTLAEEARFMYAFSLYESSPSPDLDQTSSIDAMASMQEFLNRYPESKFRDRAIDVIFTTQKKLEKKGFDNALHYYKVRSFKAAVVALNNFKKDFPDSKYLEETHYYIILSHYKLAQQSIIAKQGERYREVVENYKTFVDRYPNSSFLRDAEKLYSNSLEIINKQKNTNS